MLPAELPLFVRISATDWIEGGWTDKQSVELAKRLKTLGVDLVGASSGELAPTAKSEADIRTGAVGLIMDATFANEIVTGGDANLVFIAREFLRDPYFALNAQRALGAEPDWPVTYGYAVRRRS